MAEAAERQRWRHTSAVLCLIANCHRDPKKTRLFAPADFDPFSPTKKRAAEKVGVSVLKHVFVDRRPGGSNHA